MRGLRMGAGLLAALLMGWGAGAEPIALYFPHTGEMEIYDSSDAKAFTDFASPTDVHTAHGITFNLFVEDIRLNTNEGFDGTSGAAALAAAKEAMTYIANVLNVPAARTLDVLFNVSDDDAEAPTLASAGTFFPLADGFVNGSAFSRIASGVKPFGSSPEITVNMNFGHNWNFTTGGPGGGQFDYITVMIHELTHGLGISSLTRSDGNSRFIDHAEFPSRAYTTWDQLLTRGDGGTALWSGNPPGANNAADLTSGDVFFNGAQARTGYDQAGVAGGVYAPGTFISGSSISHFNTGNIVGGAIMEHAVSSGVQKRSYAPLEIGALIDIGYANAAAAEGEGEGEGAPEGEGEGTPDPPVVSIGAGTAFVEEGDDLTLSANASNFTPTEYQWIKDSADIGGETGSSLVLTAITVLDAGTYQVRASDGSKTTVTSGPFVLNVLAPGALPVGSLLGLSALAGLCALSGLGAVRRKQ